MTFDDNLTIDGKPYFEETHFRHVRAIEEKYRINAQKKDPLIEKKIIESKHGQTKRK